MSRVLTLRVTTVVRIVTVLVPSGAVSVRVSVCSSVSMPAMAGRAWTGHSWGGRRVPSSRYRSRISKSAMSRALRSTESTEAVRRLRRARVRAAMWSWTCDRAITCRPCVSSAYPARRAAAVAFQSRVNSSQKRLCSNVSFWPLGAADGRQLDARRGMYLACRAVGGEVKGS